MGRPADSPEKRRPGVQQCPPAPLEGREVLRRGAPPKIHYGPPWVLSGGPAGPKGGVMASPPKLGGPSKHPSAVGEIVGLRVIHGCDEMRDSEPLAEDSPDG